MSGHAIIDLPTGRVEVWNESSEVFATDRKITQAEYDTIHDILQRQHEALSESFRLTNRAIRNAADQGFKTFEDSQA